MSDTHDQQEGALEIPPDYPPLRDLAEFLSHLDDPDYAESRRTITLTKIIELAKRAINGEGPLAPKEAEVQSSRYAFRCGPCNCETPSECDCAGMK